MTESIHAIYLSKSHRYTRKDGANRTSSAIFAKRYAKSLKWRHSEIIPEQK